MKRVGGGGGGDGDNPNYILLAVGVVLIFVPVFVVLGAPNPNRFDEIRIYLRISAALGAGLVATALTGFLGFTIIGIRATGAFAAVILMFSFPPAESVRKSLQVISIKAVNYAKVLNAMPDTCNRGADHYGADLLLTCDRPAYAVFDFNSNVSGVYNFSVEYATQESRPVNITFNESKSSKVIFESALREITKGYEGECWTSKCLGWVEVGQVQLNEGSNTMKIASNGWLPHLHQFRFEPVN